MKKILILIAAVLIFVIISCNNQNQLSEKQLTFTNSLISYKLELLNLKIQSLYDFEKKQSVTPVTAIDNKKN